jgi:hypothetical protein
LGHRPWRLAEDFLNPSGWACREQEHHDKRAGDFEFGDDVEPIATHIGERIVVGVQRLIGPGMFATVELAQLGDWLGKQAHLVGRGPQGEFTKNRHLLIERRGRARDAFAPTDLDACQSRRSLPPDRSLGVRGLAHNLAVDRRVEAGFARIFAAVDQHVRVAPLERQRR